MTVNRLRRARDTRNHGIAFEPSIDTSTRRRSFNESSQKWCVHIIIRLMASFLWPSPQQQQQ